MLMYSCMAGGMDRLALPPHSRPGLDGFLLEGPVHSPQLPIPLPLTTLLLLLVMISFAGFGKSKKNPRHDCNLSPEERSVMRHFCETHTRTNSGRFVVPLPKNPQAKPLGESRSQAVRRFLSLERSLHSKDQFSEFPAVMEEYFEMQHAELIPVDDLQKPPEEVFYLPMHAVMKEHSTTTKIQAVFDASAKSSTGVFLNDIFLVGLTVHSPLIDVLLRFRLHRVALTTNVSKISRAIELVHLITTFTNLCGDEALISSSWITE